MEVDGDLILLFPYGSPLVSAPFISQSSPRGLVMTLHHRLSSCRRSALPLGPSSVHLISL